MISYQNSSQKSDWTFSSEEIDSHRGARLKNFFNLSSSEISKVLQDEKLALRYFSRQILIVFGVLGSDTPKLKKKWRLAATSAVYFRRFYQQHVLAEHDPRTVMLACIFLASKCEEGFVDLRSLRQHIHSGASNQDILQAEVFLVETLRFDLKVHHPHPLLHSLLAGVKRQLNHSHTHTHAQVSALAARWLERSEHALHVLLTTDAPLIYSPLTLACFALTHTAEEDVILLLDLHQHLQQHIHHLHVNPPSDSYPYPYTYTNIQGQLELVRESCEEGDNPFNMHALAAYMRRLKDTNRWHTLRREGEGDVDVFT